MFFRRSSSRRRSARTFGRRRFGRGLRQQQDLRKWEYGNFRVTQALSTTSGNQLSLATAFAQIGDHLADSATVPGLLEMYKLRAVEVGGIVFSWNVFLNQAPLAALSAHAIIDGAWFVDRLSFNGNPNALMDFGTNATPIVGAASVSSQETGRATRCLWRESRILPIGANDVGLAHPQVYHAGSRSLRPRIRLVDDFGLFFNTGAFQSTGVAANFTSIVNGALYWRAAYK